MYQETVILFLPLLQVPLASLANVQARWTAIRGSGVKGDIAIDDVTYEGCGIKTCSVPVADRQPCPAGNCEQTTYKYKLTLYYLIIVCPCTKF